MSALKNGQSEARSGGACGTGTFHQRALAGPWASRASPHPPPAPAPHATPRRRVLGPPRSSEPPPRGLRRVQEPRSGEHGPPQERDARGDKGSGARTSTGRTRPRTPEAPIPNLSPQHRGLQPPRGRPRSRPPPAPRGSPASTGKPQPGTRRTRRL